ncbi:transposase DDE domain protein [Moorella thermoacetica]|nr:transposase DDE domain protein [Moorella thermoacetica]
MDKYVKKATTLQIIKLLAFAQLEQHDGLRDISNRLYDPQFSRTINLNGISFSQISRRLRDLSPEFIRLLFSYLTTQAGKEIGFVNLRNAVGRIYLIDSTTISLCLTQYRWAELRKTKGGVKLHLRLRFFEEEVLLDKAVIITPARPADKTQMDALDRNRWQIELFFKWLKQHFEVKHFYGKSEQAVENRLFKTLITYCLIVMLQLKAGYGGPLQTIKRLIHTCLYEPFTFFVQTLHRKPQHSSRCRGRIDHERVYQETVRQVLAGEADYLNDVTYDPLVL